MLLRIKFALLAGILLGSTALTVDARGGTLRNARPSPAQLDIAIGVPACEIERLAVRFGFRQPRDRYITRRRIRRSPIGQIEGLLSLPAALAIDKSNNLYV